MSGDNANRAGNVELAINGATGTAFRTLNFNAAVNGESLDFSMTTIEVLTAGSTLSIIPVTITTANIIFGGTVSPAGVSAFISVIRIN